MKKIPMICNIVSVVLAIAFAIKSIIDYSQYDKISNSAPFSAQVWVNALCLIIPAIIAFVIGIIIKKKQ